MIGFLRRPRAKLILLGVAAYVAFLLVNLPAAWLGRALERASGGALALGAPGGTVWSGNGALARRSGGAYRHLADFEWRFRPLGLLTGKLSVALSGSTNGGRIHANVDLGPGGVTLKDVDADAAAGELAPLVPMLAIAKPEGRLRVQANHLEARRDSLRGAATIEWTDAGLPGMRSPRLGDYRLQITGNGDRADLRLATLRGDLRLNGQGEWRAAQPGTVQLRGVAQVSGGRDDLEALLPLLGARGTGNSRSFVWTLPIGRLAG